MNEISNGVGSFMTQLRSPDGYSLILSYATMLILETNLPYS
jgi:hypothetical protein